MASPRDPLRQEVASIGEDLIAIAAHPGELDTEPLGELLQRLALVFGKIDKVKINALLKQARRVLGEEFG